MKQYNTKHTAALSNRGFYTILSICGLIIAISAWILWSSVRDEPAEEQPVPATPIVKPVNPVTDRTAEQPALSGEAAEPAKSVGPAEAADVSATAQPEEKEQEQKPEENAKKEQTAAPAESAETVHGPVYVRPVSGEILMPFSGDELLFQPTLGDWRVHRGTDFAAEPGETILALTDGTVKEVFEDGLYGTCVTIAHDAELTTMYCGFAETRVIPGQAVKAGEALGTCAETIAAEAALDTHLHVEAARAGTPIDILSLLGEDEVE